MKKFLTIILFITPYYIFPQGVVINEIMTSNTTTIYDEDGSTSDWIELYNNNSVQVNLDGYYISDDSTDVKKWQFGNAVINPGEYLIVFASGKDTIIDYWHTNFKISAAGEEIILSDTGGTLIDKINIPPSFSDISFGSSPRPPPPGPPPPSPRRCAATRSRTAGRCAPASCGSSRGASP